jgi:5-methyltetrahydropteroyltriglutamate--homocysteine methyltransferase
MERIRTTHTGSLPRPPEMLAALRARFSGPGSDDAAYEAALKMHVAAIVRKQVEAGIDIVTDGECSKPSFRAYLAERIGGFESRVPKGGLPVPSPLDPNGRDAKLFPDYYRGVQEHSPFVGAVRVAPRVCTGPIKYAGRRYLERDIANLKSAMAEAGAADRSMPSPGPRPTGAQEP